MCSWPCRGSSTSIRPSCSLYGLIFAIAALGFNLLLGYTGLLSFGHSAYFGLGAYSVAFMVRYLGIGSMEVCILGGLAGHWLVISALFGYVCVRHTRIFFGILTLALSQVLWSLAFKFFWVTGGTDGMRVAARNFTLLGGLDRFQGPQRLPVVRLRPTTTTCWFCSAFARCGHVGDRALALRQGAAGDPRQRDARRASSAFRCGAIAGSPSVISGIFTGLAGILWVPLNGLTTPDILYWPFSGEIVFMTVLGGFRTFTGPIVGAIVFNYLKVYAVASSQYWQMVLGVVLVVLVMVLPTGIVGTLARQSGQAQEEDDDMALLADHRPQALFRRDARRRQRQPLHRGARVRLARRSQRRRQDLAHQRHQRAAAARTRARSSSRARISRALSVTERVKAGIARSFQLVNVFDDLTAFDNVALAIFSREGKTAQSGQRSPTSITP